MRAVRAAGLDAMRLATQLLQRTRRADPQVGLWEAADVQWWWRTPRRSDDVEKLFWIDDEGPVAGVLLTSWTADDWQCDPVVVPRTHAEPELIWRKALEDVAKHSGGSFGVPVSDDDQMFRELALRDGLIAGDQDSTAWMDVADPPTVTALPEGFVLVDRTQDRDAPHPLRHRSGNGVAQRLAECSLYDPSLDLAVETADGRTAGYSLYWFDPTTEVGLIEPVRVEEEFQRHGLARAMLSAGIDRLVARGARRVKVSYVTDAAAALYQALGFRRTSTATWFQASSPHVNSRTVVVD